jgi:hypothetical protein
MERDRPNTPKGSKSPASSRDDKAPGAKSRVGKPYERPRGGQARPISDLMPDIGRTAFRRFGFVQSSVVTRWPEIVGPIHANVCMPEAIRFPPGEKNDGILQLVVMPAHAPIISCVIPEIIERVNRFFGYQAVAKVKMRQGQVMARPKSTAHVEPPSLKPIPIELGDSLRDVGDPELKAVLESLARSIARQDET